VPRFQSQVPCRRSNFTRDSSSSFERRQSESQPTHGQLSGTAIAAPTIPAVAGQPGATFVFSQILGVNHNRIAVTCFSAHCHIEDAAVTVSTSPRTTHDFGGFPR